ncbi:MAG TPA: hypothetical protein VM597_25180 [Gemmataceae bacterium]|nr:hypothetical protein [Gemmataceae bacterium]
MTPPLTPAGPTTVEWREPADETPAVRLAAALVRDQIDHWQAGHRRAVETYLVAFPALARYPAVGLALAANEFLLRMTHGDGPTLDEYARRFPEWADRLAAEVGHFQQLTGTRRPGDGPGGLDLRPASPRRPGAGPDCPGSSSRPNSAAAGWRSSTGPGRRPSTGRSP